MKLSIKWQRLFIAVSFFIVLFFSGAVLAGDIFGSVTPHRDLIEAEVECDGARFMGDVDRYGSYKIRVRKTGRCKIKFRYRGKKNDWTNTFTIRAYRNPRRYDFRIDGDNNLRRE